VAQEELNSFLAVAEDLRVKGLTQNSSSAPQVKNFPTSSRSSQPEKTHSRPPDKDPPIQQQSFKRPRISALPPHNEPDDDIQEVMPVKSEPRDPPLAPPPVAMPQQVQPVVAEYRAPSSQALTPALEENYAEESYEDYGQYEGVEGYDVEGMMDQGMDQGMNANKGDLEPVKDPSELFKYVGYNQDESKHFCLICHQFSHSSRSNTRNHIEALHFANNFTYSCPVCEKNLGSRNALQTHVSRRHKN